MDSSPIAGFLFFICSVTALASRFYLAERSALGPKIYLVTRFVGMYCTLLGTDLTEIFSSSNIELLPREAKNVIQGGVGIGFLFAFVLASAIFSVEAKYFAKRENYFNKNT